MYIVKKLDSIKVTEVKKRNVVAKK